MTLRGRRPPRPGIALRSWAWPHLFLLVEHVGGRHCNSHHRTLQRREPACGAARATVGGPDPADAVRLTPGALRSHRAPRARLLLEIGVRAIARRWADRHARRAGLGSRDA